MASGKTRRQRPWTKREVQQLQRQFLQGVTVRLDGRSPKAINFRLRKLGLILSRRTIRRWTKREVQMLTLFKKYRGWSLKTIWRQCFPNRTYASVKDQARRRGFVNPRRSAQAKRAQRMTPTEATAFHRFLAGSGRRMATAAVADRFNVGVSRVWRHRQKLGLQFTMADARSLPEYQAKAKTAAAKSRQLNQQRSVRWREKRLRAMTNWAMALRKREPRCTERTCRRCGKTWPEDKRFFPPVKALGKRGQKKYLSHTCRPCTNQHRDAWQRRRQDVRSSHP